MKLKLFLFLVSIAVTPGITADVIILMGPSCAGKSTLSSYVCKKLIALKQEWVVVDFDEVNENIDEVLMVTNEYIKNNMNVIIDTNTYRDGMEKEIDVAGALLKIVVTAPLDVLLARDAQRAIRLQRTEKRAQRCRHFVITSFNESSTWACDMIVDTSQQSAEQASDAILVLYKDAK